MDQTMMSVAAEEEEQRISFGSTGARGVFDRSREDRDPRFSKQKEL